MTFGCIALTKTQPGSHDEVVSILLSAAGGLREAGCDLYLVGLPHDDDVTIWVTEVWQTKGPHDAWLELPEAVSEAMPKLKRGSAKQELSVASGLGL
ncbi:antibiotic biosynthesis monooxygenase family protein [Streptomyces sp. NPDC001222]|uniref:antibiotic biosynthesis monooxygenase family protein n=1 Tax=Streptomyces sp. NPDC001222 TaxID=3364548 RepID=UPI0036D2001E